MRKKWRGLRDISNNFALREKYRTAIYRYAEYICLVGDIVLMTRLIVITIILNQHVLIVGHTLSHWLILHGSERRAIEIKQTQLICRINDVLADTSLTRSHCSRFQKIPRMTILLIQESIRRKEDKEPDGYIYFPCSLKILRYHIHWHARKLRVLICIQIYETLLLFK